MADMLERKWWAWQGLNLRPLRCQGRHIRDYPQKTAVFQCSSARTSREQMRNYAPVYRSFTAEDSA